MQKTQTIDFHAMMTQNIQLAAYDIYQVMKTKRTMTVQDKHTLVLNHHPAGKKAAQTHLISAR